MPKLKPARFLPWDANHRTVVVWPHPKGDLYLTRMRASPCFTGHLRGARLYPPQIAHTIAEELCIQQYEGCHSRLLTDQELLARQKAG